MHTKPNPVHSIVNLNPMVSELILTERHIVG